jgi:hypothetical protein
MGTDFFIPSANPSSLIMASIKASSTHPYQHTSSTRQPRAYATEERKLCVRKYCSDLSHERKTFAYSRPPVDRTLQSVVLSLQTKQSINFQQIDSCCLHLRLFSFVCSDARDFHEIFVGISTLIQKRVILCTCDAVTRR